MAITGTDYKNFYAPPGQVTIVGQCDKCGWEDDLTGPVEQSVTLKTELQLAHDRAHRNCFETIKAD